MLDFHEMSNAGNRLLAALSLVGLFTHTAQSISICICLDVVVAWIITMSNAAKFECYFVDYIAKV